MLRRYADGESCHRLAREFGCSHQGMWRILKAHGAQMRYHGRVEGRRALTEGEYVRVQVDRSDPIAVAMGWVNGFVLEHRVVMARSLGRPLAKHETVHHLNGDRQDNRLENLQLRSGKHGKGVRMQCMDCGSHNVGAVTI